MENGALFESIPSATAETALEHLGQRGDPVREPSLLKNNGQKLTWRSSPSKRPVPAEPGDHELLPGHRGPPSNGRG